MKLHLACWHRYIPGWTHVDVCDMPHIDYISPMHQLPFLKSNSVDIIYNSHSLGYLSPEELELAFTEWYRVLKPNGILRLSVPDLKAAWKVYEKTDDINTLAGLIYGRLSIFTPAGKKTITMQSQYDVKSLTKIFTTHKFYNIEQWDWRKTEHSDIDDYSQAYWPHMQKDDGIMLSLNIQAQKYAN